MTKFTTLEEIEAEYPERENETVKERKQRQYVNLNEELANAKKRIYIFRIQGELYYQIGGLMLRNDNQKLTFDQIYFYNLNMNNQLQRRQEIFSNLNAEMLKILQDELSVNNPFVEQFVTSGVKAKSESNNLQ
ncbi:7903_t:CDS:2 [Funneliformis mosseae]|uniref:7903_t:CDS:1 n=1 Tax=Funneliformis mosseae TaxID=27381 RepID=A0A9N9HAD5_FUNMO|nr:7903_t:CDS:2 [Funneliformis mosseae]